MFYVSNANGSIVEPLVNIADDFQINQSTDGEYSISFTCFKKELDIQGYNLLSVESKFYVNGEEFSVKQCNENEFSKQVTAISSFYNNSKVYIYNKFEGQHSIVNHLNFIFNDTAWSFQISNDLMNSVNYIEGLGEDNVVALVLKVCQFHNCEFKILKNNEVLFTREIGPDNNFQFRYNYNLSDIVMQEDTTNLYTKIVGYGANDLMVTYTSPNSSVFGILEAAPVKDDRFTNPATLTEYIKSKIIDVPELSIQTSSPELLSLETGERVWLIHEKLGIKMKTRIISQTKSFVGGKLVTTSVVIGNSKPKTSSDILVSQQESINENEVNLEENKQRFRSEIIQTNDRITLEVEELDVSIAAINIKADNINLSVNNRITQEVASININSNNIELSVNNRITQESAAINIRANQIESSVTNLSNSTNSSITQLSNNINLKIDKGGAITDINLSPGVATINADRINLNGAVLVNGTISGATSIEVSTNVILGRSLMFSDFTALTTGGGNLTLEANNAINYVGTTHYFNGTVDFSNANVIGL